MTNHRYIALHRISGEIGGRSEALPPNFAIYSPLPEGEGLGMRVRERTMDNVEALGNLGTIIDNNPIPDYYYV